MTISADGLALLGLTAIVAVLVGILAYALMRFAAAARDTRRHLGDSQTEHALLSAALAEAIGRLKQQERAMTERAEASERFSTEIVDGLTSGLIVVTRDGAVQIVNPAARRILHLGEAAATELRAVTPLMAVIDEAMGSGAAIVRRTVRIPRGGGVSHLGVTVSPLIDPQGLVHAVICLFTDLTDAIALEEQLRLKEALARLGELTAGLAHEFRNGLATVHGYAQLLDPTLLPEPQRTYVESIRGETENLGGLVSKFLEFARPEPLTMAPVDLRVVVDRAVRDVAEPDAITVRGEFGHVDGDEVLLRQAIGNLLRNGLEACAGAGREARVDVLGELDADGRGVRVTVADEGPGLADAVMAHLFRPFFTTRAQGTGLGLAIVQKVIVSHNGRVSATNRPDGGAAFCVTLPRLQARDS